MSPNLNRRDFIGKTVTLVWRKTFDSPLTCLMAS